MAPSGGKVARSVPPGDALAYRLAGGRGAQPPEGIDRHRHEALAERERVFAGVEEDAANEPVAQAVTQEGEAAKVPRAFS
jgi:hypothetical protein